jgi:NADP-dependent 3-hydroxy acid dehydrogenase YdfG
MDLNLKNRVAVVTCGGSGIGEGIARALAAEGCNLCILDRDASAAQMTASSLAATGIIAQSTAIDVGDSAAVEKLSRKPSPTLAVSIFSSMQPACSRPASWPICPSQSGSG